MLPVAACVSGCWLTVMGCAGSGHDSDYLSSSGHGNGLSPGGVDFVPRARSVVGGTDAGTAPHHPQVASGSAPSIPGERQVGAQSSE